MCNFPYEDEGNKFLRKFGNFLTEYTLSHTLEGSNLQKVSDL
jgi:hypothetical protein